MSFSKVWKDKNTKPKKAKDLKKAKATAGVKKKPQVDRANTQTEDRMEATQ